MPRPYLVTGDTLTLVEAGRRLGVNYRTLRKWISLGYLRAVEIKPAASARAIRRVPVSEVERLKREMAS